eukprot:3578112-Pleurochrysis_carterae.AAC.2
MSLNQHHLDFIYVTRPDAVCLKGSALQHKNVRSQLRERSVMGSAFKAFSLLSSVYICPHVPIFSFVRRAWLTAARAPRARAQEQPPPKPAQEMVAMRTTRIFASYLSAAAPLAGHAALIGDSCLKVIQANAARGPFCARRSHSLAWTYDQGTALRSPVSSRLKAVSTLGKHIRREHRLYYRLTFGSAHLELEGDWCDRASAGATKLGESRVRGLLWSHGL